MNSNKEQVFKGLLDEFSNKPYISVSHNYYPVDDDEESKEGTPPLSDRSLSSSDEEQFSQQNSLSLKPKKRQLSDVAKLNIFINISPQDFLEIKRQYGYYSNKVNVTQFIIIFLDVLTNQTVLDQKNAEYVNALISLFQMIDIYEFNIITFDQLSNFLVEMHEILSRDQGLFEIKLKNKQLEKQYDHAPIERIFELPGYKGFAYLEQNLKTVRIVSPVNWEEILNVSIGATTIVSTFYIQSKNTLLITSNDKFLNFFDLQSHKLQRRFMVPDVQVFVSCSNRKGLIYTAALNGTIYTWDLEKIFTKEFLKAMNRHPDCFKIVLKSTPINNHDGSAERISDKSLSAMLLIEALDILATGSSDTIIRLFENKRKLTNSHKELRGHSKAIKALAYCSQYKYLISCSYDFDVLVWNIYLDHPLAKLVGHEAPLVTILTVQEKKPYLFSLILSCDAKGVLKVWDPKTFQTIQQISISEGESRSSSIVYKKEFNMVLLGHKKLQIYEIDQSFDPNVTDDKLIISMCHSKKYQEIHLATVNNIKTWDLTKGVIKRILKDVGNGDITSMVLEKNDRRLFVGLHNGKIVVIDVFTGFKLRETHDFQKEVCFLGYSDEYNLLVSISWDKQIRIYKDFNELDKKPDKDLSLRIVKNSHPQEVVCGQFSEHLMLIATTTREGDIRLWDFEKGNFITRLPSNGKEITSLRFLDPYPLLIACDITGAIYIYIVRPHKHENQLAIIWKNMFTIMKAIQVNCIEHYHKKENYKDFQLILGDENGDIRIISLDELFIQAQILPLSFEELAANKNPHRFFQLTFQEYETQQLEKIPTEGIVNEKCARQLLSWKAHKVGIRQIILVYETFELTLISLGQDRIVRLWSLNGKQVGILKQGVDPNIQTPPYQLQMKSTYLTRIQQIEENVRKTFDQTKVAREKLKRAKTIPFKKDDDEIAKLGHVESKDIFKDLQEINWYLDRKKDQDDNDKKRQKKK